MTFSPIASYPNSRAYVLKLHRDAGPSPTRLFGRLENLATGRHCEFASAAGLLAVLLSDVALGNLGDRGADPARSET